MATWSGWQADLLTAANLPNNQPTRNFLTDWNQHAQASCRNNPVDISSHASGSTSCHKLTGTRTSQNYLSHAQAASAFDAQLKSQAFPNLDSGIRDEVMWEPGFAPGIYADLQEWGSLAFADWYKKQFGANFGGGGPGAGSISAPRAHGGWSSLRVTFNQKMPAALHASQRTTNAALRTLQRARKVRL